MKHLYLLMILCLLSMESIGQSNVTVKGQVLDQKGTPLPGATVVQEGTSNGTVTDLNGQFTMEVSEEATLIASFIGYKSKKVAVSGQTAITFELGEDLMSLSEVVVVGYGTRKVSDLTGAVGTISENRLDAKPNANIEQALQGAVPGLNITQNGGSAEGGNSSILIRGRNSITAGNGPLVVLDGVPYNGNLSDINPNDVNSITVLKDASSTAIYGSRGSNGVIIVETKKGKPGKVRISYNGYYSVQQLTNLPDLYDGPGFAAFKDARLGADGAAPEDRLTPSEVDVLESGEDVDWLDLVTRLGSRQDHNVSVSGGTEKTKYYVSLGYHDSKGVTINDNFQRYSLRINLSFDITDNLRFGTSTQLSRIDRSGNTPGFSGTRDGAFIANPLTTAFDEEGNPTIYPWPEDVFVWNPLYPTLEINDDLNNKIFTNNFLELSLPFIEGLKYKINTGIEYDARNIGNYAGRNTGPGFERNGEAGIIFRKDENYLVENLLTYNKSFGLHSIDFTGLYSVQIVEELASETEAVGFVSDALSYYQIDNSSSGAVNDTNYEKDQLLSQMGRFNYIYSDKYFLTLTVRRDGYSGFPADNRYGIFPSAAIGWNISDESFFNITPINYLKIRTSYGVNGNQAVGAYQNLATLNTRPWVIGSTTAPGFVINDLASPNLKWEQTTTLNVGLDFGFLDNRFQLSADAYLAKTEDLLLARLIPSINGDTRVTQNVGEVENRGLELVAQGFIIDKSKLKWNFKANAAWNQNKIVSLFGANQDDIGNQWFIGQPIRVNYGYDFDGIWQEGDDFENSAQTEAEPGFVRVLDVDNEVDDAGNPILQIDPERDRVLLGQQDPKVIFGMENTLSYGNLSLYVFLQGVGGVTKRNPYRSVAVGGDVRSNWVEQQFWTAENPINDYHSIDPDANSFNVGFYENASFVRIRDITLSYRFDNKLFGNANLNGLQIFTTIRNLATFTEYNALDPEFDDQFATPLQREYVFGLKFSL